MKRITGWMTLCSVAVLMAWAGHARAATITFDSEEYRSDRLGTLFSLLALENSPNEAGGVAWNGASDVLTGDAVNPSLSVATINLTAAGMTYEKPDLILVLKVDEPEADPGVRLEELNATFYDTAGGILFQASTDTPYDLGQHSSSAIAGWVFRVHLDDAEATTFLSDPLYRIGLDAEITGSAGLAETIRVGTVSEMEVIPLPSAAGLTLLGLGMVMGYRKLGSKQGDTLDTAA